MNEWVDVFLESLQKLGDNNYKIKWTDNTGHEVVTQVSVEVVNLLLANRHRLGRISLDVFKEALLNFSDLKTFDALYLIYNELDTQSLLDKYKENAEAMAGLAAQIQEDRTFWTAFANQAGARIVYAALAALL